MTINQNLETFAGLPVVSWDDDRVAADPASVAWSVMTDEYDVGTDEFEVAFEGLVARAGEDGPSALVIGQWGGAFDIGPPLDLFVRHAPRLSRLRALFLGDLRFEECEISWIQQRDVGPLLTAFPRLERLVVRGATGLELHTPLRHESLRDLEFQTGGLPAHIIRSITTWELPALERLHLWLGVRDYGGDYTLDDLRPLLDARAVARWPHLTSLGLCDSTIQDEIAAEVAGAPVVARLRELSLAMGTLGDAGAAALLAGQPLDHLDLLDLHHHYISEPVARRLVEALPSVRVDLSGPRVEPQLDGRFVAVSE
ncbi:STM4015 family protein [Catenuloplanes japonicus]|uniref:STM4015 family protein n=1 Tax=Catenuloplanes japonicus TaxID=33876 RepID=UPI0005248B59|nr:STM4015 family protein [Catenuloplanes japonicus]